MGMGEEALSSHTQYHPAAGPPILGILCTPPISASGYPLGTLRAGADSREVCPPPASLKKKRKNWICIPSRSLLRVSPRARRGFLPLAWSGQQALPSHICREGGQPVPPPNIPKEHSPGTTTPGWGCTLLGMGVDGVDRVDNPGSLCLALSTPLGCVGRDGEQPGSGRGWRRWGGKSFFPILPPGPARCSLPDCRRNCARLPGRLPRRVRQNLPVAAAASTAGAVNPVGGASGAWLQRGRGLGGAANQRALKPPADSGLHPWR